MPGRKQGLRSGYTTGACAAAAAKAAALLVMGHLPAGRQGATRVTDVEIPFPDRKRVKFRIQGSGIRVQESSAWASIIKDAGDDPDITHGAKIKAEVKMRNKELRIKNKDSKNFNLDSVLIKGGTGVGVVTKPGLPVPVGEPAITPVPRQMIKEAVMEALTQNTEPACPAGRHRIQNTDKSKEKNSLSSELRAPGSDIEVTISVPNGKELAKKTLNARLGILGGISILGTTGIVKPVSTEAWTATITSSMDVANAMGHKEIVLSAGRTSEKAHIRKYNLPEESYVLIGDYLEYSLREAKRHGFKRIYLCAQWAKMLKIAMATPQTHVRFGAINVKKAVELLNSFEAGLPQSREFNTAREIFESLNLKFKTCLPEGKVQNIKLITNLCNKAKHYAENVTKGLSVTVHLVSYEKEIIASSE